MTMEAPTKNSNFQKTEENVSQSSEVDIFSAPIIDSIRTVQHIQDQFIAIATPNESEHDLLQHLHAEIQELESAMVKEDRSEIASEIADVFIFLTHVGAQYNIPLEVAVSDKLARNAHKYNPYTVKQLRESGLSGPEAIAVLKSQWNRSRDKKEFSRI